MSRSGYVDWADWDGDGNEQWAMIRQAGALKKAIRGERGQVFMKSILAALDAMPSKRLIREEFESGGDVCTLGVIGRDRGIDMSKWDPEDWDTPARAAKHFNVAESLTRQIIWENDDAWSEETPEERWSRMRQWVAEQIKQ